MWSPARRRRSRTRSGGGRRRGAAHRQRARVWIKHRSKEHQDPPPARFRPPGPRTRSSPLPPLFARALNVHFAEFKGAPVGAASTADMTTPTAATHARRKRAAPSPLRRQFRRRGRGQRGRGHRRYRWRGRRRIGARLPDVRCRSPARVVAVDEAADVGARDPKARVRRLDCRLDRLVAVGHRTRGRGLHVGDDRRRDHKIAVVELREDRERESPALGDLLGPAAAAGVGLVA